MQIGRYFTLDELTVSQEAVRRGLNNTPNAAQVAALQALVKNILDPLRAHYGKPIIVSSGFRSAAVNAAVRGSSTSQHRFGEAADFTVPGVPVADVVQTIRKLGLPFDQVIDEFGSWVHVSYGPRHRRQPLKARKVGGVTKYLPLA